MSLEDSSRAVGLVEDPASSGEEKGDTQPTDEEIISIDRQEFDCPLCLQLLYEPLTLECGHSFCRDCVSQALQRKRHCPLCRHHSTIDADDYPSNVLITNILQKYIHSAYVQRAKETHLVKKLRKCRHPIFVGSTPEFPHCSISLRIFEAKYRVMVNRIMNSDSKFIMASTGHHHQVSQSPHPIGTLCKIKNCQSFVDGRSHIQVVGLKRVKLSNVKPENDSFGLLSAEIDDYLDVLDQPSSPSDECTELSESEHKSNEIRQRTDNISNEMDSVERPATNRFSPRYSEPDGFWNFIAKLKVNIDENLNFQRREWLNNNETENDEDSSMDSAVESLSEEELMEQIMDTVDHLAVQKRSGGNRELFYQRAGHPPSDISQFGFWIAGTLPRWTYQSGASHVEISQIQLRILMSRDSSERLRLAHSLAILCTKCSERRSKLQFWIIAGIIAIAVLYELFNGS